MYKRQVLREINVPIYSTKLTNGIIEHKLREHNMLTKVKRKMCIRDRYEIKQRFIDEVTQIPGVTVNGKTGRDSAPQIVSVTIEDVRSEVMLHSLEEYGIYVSAGSACSSNKPAPSRTLQGIGLPKQKLESTIRISFCVNTTEEEVDYAVEKMKEIIPFRRKFTRK